MLLLVNNLHEKHITEIQDGQNFGSVHMLFVICTCVSWKMHWFSANQTCIIYSCTLLESVYMI